MDKTTPGFTGKLVRVAGQFYFFNTLAGSIDAVDKNTASFLSTCGNSHGGLDVPRASHLANDVRPFVRNPYSRAELEATLSRKLRLLVLELTRACNMACAYCVDGDAYESKDCLGSANMREDVAIRGVDYLLEHSSDHTQPLAISFYGGEPLLRFSLLEKIVKYAKNRAAESNRYIVFSVTTNGTLLTPDIAKFLINNSIQMIVSLDGPKETNNRHRTFKGGGGTFESVIAALEMVRNMDADYFNKLVRCSVVVTPGSDLEELQEFFRGIHVNIIANFVDTYGLNVTKLGCQDVITGLKTLKARAIAQLVEGGRDVFELIDLSKDFGTALLSPMIKRFLKSESSSQQMCLGQCILGASRLYLSADNFYYPCEKVAGHSFARIGTIETGIDVNRVEEILAQFYDMAGNRCSGCWMSSRCSACIALACSGNKIDIEKYGHYCRGTKAWGESALEMVISWRNAHNTYQAPAHQG